MLVQRSSRLAGALGANGITSISFANTVIGGHRIRIHATSRSVATHGVINRGARVCSPKRVKLTDGIGNRLRRSLVHGTGEHDRGIARDHDHGDGDCEEEEGLGTHCVPGKMGEF